MLSPPGALCQWQDDPLNARILAPVDEASAGKRDVAKAEPRNNQAVSPTFRRAKIAEHSR